MPDEIIDTQIELLIEELPGVAEANFKPFAHPYYQRLKGFMGARSAHANATFPKGTFAPKVVPKAYKFPVGTGTPKPVKFGIISLGGNVPKSDVAKFCQDSGYPMPNLKLIALSGANTTNDPGGGNVENNLDWQMIMQAWHNAYPNVPCDITICFGPNTDKGIADCATQLAKIGCLVISISWGAAKPQWTPAAIAYHEAAFSAIVAMGVFIDAASGDNSIYDSTGKRAVDYPCASIYVNAVGGTSLAINGAGDYQSERAWGDGKPGDEGGGGGFATDTPIPPYQQGVVPGSFRGVPDLSANADPQTGYQIVSDGKWMVIGGTSASAPLIGGLAGVIMSMGGTFTDYHATLYVNRKMCFNDVTTGSNGDAAGVGWDTATGLGSPIGTAILEVLGSTGGGGGGGGVETIVVSQTIPAGTYVRKS